jgi:hypothetical protein
MSMPRSTRWYLQELDPAEASASVVGYQRPRRERVPSHVVGRECHHGNRDPPSEAQPDPPIEAPHASLLPRLEHTAAHAVPAHLHAPTPISQQASWPAAGSSASMRVI